MALREDVDAALEGMILSASGWRGVFAGDGGGESAVEYISPAHAIIAAAAAAVFAEYLHTDNAAGSLPVVLLGRDTRPTGTAIAETMIPVLQTGGCIVRYAGITAAPEIMAWARSAGASFVYISASHNPIGHNGLKFGRCDGGVLAAEETAKLIAAFRSLLDEADCPAALEALIAGADPSPVREVYAAEAAAKSEALRAYFDFSEDTAGDIIPALKEGLAVRSFAVACDFNGSARTVSIDRDFFTGMGIKFEAINGRPGEIVHRIVPEGVSLEPCRILLEELHRRDPAFTVGYVPDCDGDRGNLVIWDEAAAEPVRALEAQEVFALACFAELAHLVWTGVLTYDRNGKARTAVAVAVNDPTSLRIDRIAAAFDVPVFRAEVGEANVVGLARRLREKGYIVRILGEGSAGGNITHPSAVRDPLHTVLAVAKLLSLRNAAGGSGGGGGADGGLFHIWCERSGQMQLYRSDFSLADVIASLPPFVTTAAYAEEAVLRVTTADHSLLKDRYQRVFLRDWEVRKESLKTRCGIHGWEAAAYNGMEERRRLARFADAGTGGLKINFLDACGGAVAALWMRGSATEPVFRVMAEAEGRDAGIERDLIDWQRRMTLEASTSAAASAGAEYRS